MPGRAGVRKTDSGPQGKCRLGGLMSQCATRHSCFSQTSRMGPRIVDIRVSSRRTCVSPASAVCGYGFAGVRADDHRVRKQRQLDVTGSKAASSSQAASAPVTVNKSVVQSAPGGSKVKVTLVSYEPQVPESSHDALAPKVFGINLKFQNLGSHPVKANSPTYYSVLRLANTAGSTTVAHARGPCEGQFDSAPLHPRRRRSTRGMHPVLVGQLAAGRIRLRVAALSSSSGTFAAAEASTLVGPPDPRAGGRSRDTLRREGAAETPGQHHRPARRLNRPRSGSTSPPCSCRWAAAGPTAPASPSTATRRRPAGAS